MADDQVEQQNDNTKQQPERQPETRAAAKSSFDDVYSYRDRDSTRSQQDSTTTDKDNSLTKPLSDEQTRLNEGTSSDLSAGDDASRELKKLMSGGDDSADPARSAGQVSRNLLDTSSLGLRLDGARVDGGELQTLEYRPDKLASTVPGSDLTAQPEARTLLDTSRLGLRGEQDGERLTGVSSLDGELRTTGLDRSIGAVGRVAPERQEDAVRQPSDRAERGVERTSDLKSKPSLSDKEVRDLADDLGKRLKQLGATDENPLDPKDRPAGPELSPRQTERYVENIISRLSKADIERVNQAFGNKGAIDAFQKSPDASQAFKDKLDVFKEGFDGRQSNPQLTLKLAELAIKNGSLTDFKQTFADATPEARKAFFENKDQNPNLGQQAIDRTWSWSKTNNDTASEFARFGRVSGLTDVSRETGHHLWTFTNYEGVERTIRNLPPDQLQQLARGAKLQELPVGSNPTKEQLQDREAYRQFHKGLETAAGSNNVRLAYWDSLIQNGGQSNRFLDAVAGEGGRVYNGDPKSHFGKDWDKQSFDFYNDKEHGESRREQTRQVLSRFSNGQELVTRFDEKVKAGSFEESVRAGRGDLSQELGKLGRGDRRAALDELTNNKQGLDRYRTDETYRAQIDNDVTRIFGRSTGAQEARRVLDAARAGQDPPNDLLTDVRKQAIDAPSSRNRTRPATGDGAEGLRTIENGFAKDPQFRERIANPQNDGDRKLQEDFRGAARILLGEDLFNKHYGALEKGERLSPTVWSDLDKSNGGKDHRKFFQDLDRQPASERARLAADPVAQDALFKHLDKDNRQIAESVLKHGYRPADQFRAAQINGDESGATTALGKGKEEGIGQFKQDFKTAYGETAEDAVGKVFASQQLIDAERTLNGDKSLFEQFQYDARLRQELNGSWETLGGFAKWTLGSNTPDREESSFQRYSATVGEALKGDAPPQTVQDAFNRQLEFRDDQDAKSALDSSIVKTGTSVTITLASGALTGGTGWVLALGREAALRTGVALTTGAVLNPLARQAGLGRLYDNRAGNVLRDAGEGALGVYLGGGSVKDLGLVNPFTKGTWQHGAFGTLVYPSASNFAGGFTTAKLDGNDFGTSLWKGVESGALAAIGVHSGWHLNRGVQALAKDIEPGVVKNLTNAYRLDATQTAINRGAYGGTTKAEGKQIAAATPKEASLAERGRGSEPPSSGDGAVDPDKRKTEIVADRDGAISPVKGARAVDTARVAEPVREGRAAPDSGTRDGDKSKAEKQDKTTAVEKEREAVKDGTPKAETREVRQNLTPAEQFRQGLEEGKIKLPPLEKGWGPYQAVQRAAKENGYDLSHKQIRDLAVAIRDQAYQDGGKRHFKVGEQLQLKPQHSQQSRERLPSEPQTEQRQSERQRSDDGRRTEPRPSEVLPGEEKKPPPTPEELKKAGFEERKDEATNKTTWVREGKDGSRTVLDEQRRLSEQRDATGRTFKFGYNEKGDVNRVEDSKTKEVWTRKASDHPQLFQKEGTQPPQRALMQFSADGTIVQRHLNSRNEVEKAQINLPNGTTITRDKQGTQVDTVGGTRIRFDVNEKGEPTRLTIGDKSYDSKDGKTFTDGKETFKAQLLEGGALRRDFTSRVPPETEVLTPEGKTLKFDEKLRPVRPPAERAVLERNFQSIEKALGDKGSRPDLDAVRKQLEGRTKEELKTLDEISRQKDGKSLEDRLKERFKGSDLERATALATGRNDDASDIRALLLQNQEKVDRGAKKGDPIAQQKLIDTLQTKSSGDIAKIEKDFQERYGVSLKDAIAKDPSLSETTKQFLDVYLKGSDHRANNPQDVLKLADLATKSRDLDLFRTVFSDPSVPKEVRERYLKDGGEKKISDAFSGLDQRRALDYAKDGRVSADTLVDSHRSWLGDNEKAIEQTLRQMKPEERRAYLEGKKIAQGDQKNLTDQQKADLEYYKKLHGALERAAGFVLESSKVRELSKWEELISNPDGKGLINKLSEHYGTVYNDGREKIFDTIHGITKDQWEKLKSDPEHRKEVYNFLQKHHNEKDFAKFKDVLDRKLAAGTFEESQQQRRPVLEQIADRKGYIYNDQAGILRDLEGLTKEQQAEYRKPDSEFRRQLQNAIKDGVTSTHAQESARAILDAIDRGETPKIGILSQLHTHSRDWIGDTGKVVSDVEKAFKDDPKLRERIANPTTDADRQFSKQFTDALRSALGQDAFDRYGKKLIENGSLSIQDKADIYRKTNTDKALDTILGITAIANPALGLAGIGLRTYMGNGDQKGFLNSLKTASPQDLKAIADGSAKGLDFLSKEQRQLAQQIAKQEGKTTPEDEYRLAVLTGDKQAAKDVLDKLPPDKRAEFKDNYTKKYDADATKDAHDLLSHADYKVAERQLREPPKDAAEAFRRAREDRFDSVSGIGRFLVDKFWDGTGEQTVDKYHDFGRELTDYSRQNKEVPPEKLSELDTQFNDALKLFRESKTALADTIVDGAIIAAGIGGSFFTGGVSLGLLGATTIGGALFKIGTKALIEGRDYDSSWGGVLKDGLTGGIDSATSFLGPAQLALLKGLGKTTAATATKGIVTATEDILKGGGTKLLKEGSAEALEKGLAQRLAVAIGNGEKEISQKSIAKLAEEVATSPEAAKQLEKIIADGLSQGLRQETAGLLKGLGREISLNSQANSIGGLLNGTVDGIADWDANKSFAANLENFGRTIGTQLLFSGGTAAIATPAFRTAARGLHEVSNLAQTAREWRKAPTNLGEHVPLPHRVNEHVPGIKDKVEIPASWPDRLAQPVEHLPPVPEGHIRLYRGVQQGQGIEREFAPGATHQDRLRWGELAENLTGRPEDFRKLPVEVQKELRELQAKVSNPDIKFYTDDLKTAQKYAGTDGHLLYLDVPRQESFKFRKENHGLAAAGAAGETYQVPVDLHRAKAGRAPNSESLERDLAHASDHVSKPRLARDVDHAPIKDEKAAEHIQPKEVKLRQGDRPSPYKPEIHVQNASPELVKEVEEAFKNLPVELQRVVNDGKFKIVLSGSIVDNPRYNYPPGSGVRPGETQHNKRAFVDYNTNEIHIIENYKVGIANEHGVIDKHLDARISRKDIDYILSHEAGHGLDASIEGRFVTRQDFKRAVAQDWKALSDAAKAGRLSPEDKDLAGYYLAQKGFVLEAWGIDNVGRHRHQVVENVDGKPINKGAHETARREVFADVVASLEGSSPDARRFLQLFPNSADLITREFPWLKPTYGHFSLEGASEQTLAGLGFRKSINSAGEETFTNHRTGVTVYKNTAGQVEEIGVRGHNEFSNGSFQLSYDDNKVLSGIWHNDVKVDGADRRVSTTKYERLDGDRWQISRSDGSNEVVDGLKFELGSDGVLKEIRPQARLEEASKKLPTHSLLRLADFAGAYKELGEIELAVMVHGTTDRRASQLLEQGLNSGGTKRFFAAQDLDTANEFGHRRWDKDGRRGEVQFVGIAIPAADVKRLQSNKVLTLKKIDDRQALEWVFDPKALDTVNTTGYLFDLSKALRDYDPATFKPTKIDKKEVRPREVSTPTPSQVATPKPSTFDIMQAELKSAHIDLTSLSPEQKQRLVDFREAITKGNSQTQSTSSLQAYFGVFVQNNFGAALSPRDAANLVGVAMTAQKGNKLNFNQRLAHAMLQKAQTEQGLKLSKPELQQLAVEWTKLPEAKRPPIHEFIRERKR